MDEPIKKRRGRPPGRKDGPRPPDAPPRGKPSDSVVVNTAEVMETLPPADTTAISRPATQAFTSKMPGPSYLSTGSREAAAAAVPEFISECVRIRSTVDLDNPDTLWNAMEQYLQLCAMSGLKISNSFMYLSCGISRPTVSDWFHGTRRQNNPEYKRFATMIKEICAAAREQYGLEGAVNPILTIFHQKFYDGFMDNPKEEAVNDPLGEMQDPKELAQKYKDIILD